MGQKNHGQRNLATWERVSHRKREQQRRAREFGSLLGQLDELLNAFNRLVVRHMALEEFVLEHLHAHPEQTASGIRLLSRGMATPPVVIGAEQFTARVAKVRQELLDKQAAAEALAAQPTPATEAPEAEAPSDDVAFLEGDEQRRQSA